MPRTAATHVPPSDHAAAWVARRAAVRFLRAGRIPASTGLGPGRSNGTSTHFASAIALHVGGPALAVPSAPGVAHMRATKCPGGANLGMVHAIVSPQTDDSRYAPSQVCTISRSSTPVPGPAHAIVEQAGRGHSLEHGVAHHPASVRSHCPAPVLIATWEAAAARLHLVAEGLPRLQPQAQRDGPGRRGRRISEDPRIASAEHERHHRRGRHETREPHGGAGGDAHVPPNLRIDRDGGTCAPPESGAHPPCPARPCKVVVPWRKL